MAASDDGDGDAPVIEENGRSAVPSTSHCELGPCLVGGWVRGRIAGCCGACLAARCYCIRVFRVRELAGRSGSASETPPLNPPRR